MKAVNYQGAFKVKVEDVPMPKIEHPDDVVVKYGLQNSTPSPSLSVRLLTLENRVTTSAICGSDLHMVPFILSQKAKR